MYGISALVDSTGHFLQSAPVKVRMAGFESNTYALQRAGWQISVETFRRYERAAIDMRVAFKHDGIKQMALGVLSMDESQIIGSKIGPHAFVNDMLKHMGIDISYIAPMIQFHVMPTYGVMKFTAIDATPTYKKVVNLDEIAMFKPIKGEDFEIFINQKDEAEILEILLKKQDIKQKEIIHNMKRRRYMENNNAYDLPPSLEDNINTNIKHQIIVG